MESMLQASQAGFRPVHTCQQIGFDNIHCGFFRILLCGCLDGLQTRLILLGLHGKIGNFQTNAGIWLFNPHQTFKNRLGISETGKSRCGLMQVILGETLEVEQFFQTGLSSFSITRLQIQ